MWYQNALTGEEQSIDYPLGYSPVAVMVNNIMSKDSYQSAWPQSGLSKADAVFEMETEGGITRYMALFRDWTKMPVVGPIRSARDQFVQIMMPFGCLYVHDGASVYAKNMLEMYDYYDKDLQPNKGIAFRDLTEYNKGLKAKEHTEFTSGQLVDEAINSGKYELDLHGEPQQLFEWVKYDEPARVLEGVDVSEIEWRFSNSYAAKMTYNPETNKYTKEHAASSSYFCNKGKDTCCGKDFAVFPLQCSGLLLSSLATWHMGICVEWYREQRACVCLFHWPPLSTPLIVFFGSRQDS